MAELLEFPWGPTATQTPPDAATRGEALDTKRSFIVEAPAGSGKTGLLTQRYLKLLSEPSVTQPEQVLAITFTNKATAELRDRVLKHLERANSATFVDQDAESDFDRFTRTMASAVLARDALLGWQLLAQPKRMNIRTIDSVCAEIARGIPILSGSGGHLTPIENAEVLRREAARRTLLLLGSGEPEFEAALRDLILHRDGNLGECETLIAEMLSVRDQWGNLVPLTATTLDDAYLDSVVLPGLQRALEHAVCVELELLSTTLPASFVSSLSQLAADLAYNDGYLGDPSPIAAFAGCAHPPGPFVEHLDQWRALIHLTLTTAGGGWRKSFSINNIGFASSKQDKARLDAIIGTVRDRHDLREALCRASALPPAEYPADQWAVAKSLFRVLARALVELQLVFAARGQCDFTELALMARAALRDDSAAADRGLTLGARLQHLLVDEMQDTSTGQYELIQQITQRWDGHSQTVFLVGDPRQSIYLFRQARVEGFLSTMHAEALGDLPLTRLRLTANFRSQRTLVEQFNDDFARVFPQEDDPAPPNDPPYVAAQATLASSAEGMGRTWHTTTLAAPEGDRLGAIRKLQARRDAREIRRIALDWIAKPHPGRSRPWTIAVLVRSRAHLIDIVTAFKVENESGGPVPYRAVEIEILSERQEVLDLNAITRAVMHPGDRVAWLALLRAPWCGLSLADLHTLTGADDPTLKQYAVPRLMTERGHLLGEEACARLQHVWVVMQAATQRQRMTTAQLVERTWRSLGGDAWLNEEQKNNARRYLQLLDEIEGPGGGVDFNVLSERLQNLFAEGRTFPSDQPVVELLTIHKAKGLEWDVVIVPGLDRAPGGNRSRLLTWSELDTDRSESGSPLAPMMLAPIAAKGERPTALKAWLDGLQSNREAAERKRLLYVACTRAREELHLFASPNRRSSGEITVPPRSLLSAAWPAVEQHFRAVHSSNSGFNVNLEEDGPGPESAMIEIAAAAAEDQPIAAKPNSLQRVPLSFDPKATFATARATKLDYSEPADDVASVSNETRVLFTRQEGSIAARSFGNAVHAFMEILATRIAEGRPTAALLSEIPSWKKRIAAVLRSDGLSQHAVDRLVRETVRALEATLRDSDGRWLLQPHAGAANELALTQWRGRLANIRVDRIFYAGDEPGAPGTDFLWIVDYKTSDLGRGAIDEVLVRETFAPQLEAYADVLSGSGYRAAKGVRVGLYFATGPRLIWWEPKR